MAKKHQDAVSQPSGLADIAELRCKIGLFPSSQLFCGPTGGLDYIHNSVYVIYYSFGPPSRIAESAAEIAWEGNSLEVLRGFPKPIREDLGADIRRLQLGEKPLNSRPMKSIGPGVYELKQRDDDGWYRVIYLSKVSNTLHMLHSFVKKSAKTPRNDLSIASNRLKEVKSRLLEEKKNARKEK